MTSEMRPVRPSVWIYLGHIYTAHNLFRHPANINISIISTKKVPNNIEYIQYDMNKISLFIVYLALYLPLS